MPINASLFGHIQNDAFLSGTYKLEGHLFSNTSTYLKNYLESLSGSGTLVSSKYVQLLEDLNYLVCIEGRVQTTITPEQINDHIEAIAADIVTDMETLSPGKRLLLPGGWLDAEGGHSMIYELIRKDSAYFFIVYNSGDGIIYHAKKSAKEKELYNPTKTWCIPLPSTPKAKEEIKLFINRLLKARLKTNEIQTSMSAQKLYEEVLPSIVYAGGEEHTTPIPSFGYTAGQFSGTCSQRVLHQMLKLNSISLLEYQQFIFKFKLHALKDYSHLCCSGVEPFNSAVAEQILLAIENNLKILSSELFTEDQTELYFQELKELKKQINTTPLPTKPRPARIEAYPNNFIWDQDFASLSTSGGSYRYNPPPTINVPFNETSFLNELSESILKISSISDPALQYIQLEKVLLSLPLSVTGEFDTPPYTRLNSIEEYERFYQQIEQVQKILLSLQKTWLQEAQIAKLNILALSTLALQTDIHNVLNKKKRQPSFQHFTNQTLQSIIANQKRNPFWATNSPQMDERFHSLQNKYAPQKLVFDKEFYNYFKEILNTEPVLNDELQRLFTKDFGSNIAELYNSIRHHKLESLYMLSLHIAGTQSLDARFNPLIEKIKAHIAYEGTLRAAINPFFTVQYKEAPYITPEIVLNSFRVSSPLYPTFVPYQELSQKLIKHKYSLSPSHAKSALESDVPSTYSKSIEARTANHIQLHPDVDFEEQAQSQNITHKDIIARDYFHLRANPNIQIALTLDYFKRNVDKLSERSNRLYLEANLFQPGLLREAIRKKGFFSQFDEFLETSLRFFTQHGQYTPESLFFLKLNFLASNYLALSGASEGITRLENIQKEIQKQLTTSTNPEVIYTLHYYFFLATAAKIEAGHLNSEELELALNAYFYIQSHTQSSFIEESSSDKNDFDCAVARFQLTLSQENQKYSFFLERIIRKALIANNSFLKDLRLKGSFPLYDLITFTGKSLYQFNVMLGKLFENNLARSGLPLVIKNHPLIQHLQLSQPEECFISLDGIYLYLVHNKKKTKLFYHDNNLTIQQYWTIDHGEQLYELQALSSNHLAQHANKTIKSVLNGLPTILLDGSTDYWRCLNSTTEGILVQNHKALYKITGDTITLLDDKGIVTPFLLKPLKSPWASLLTNFESSQFLLHHQSRDSAYVELPRFNLRFTRVHHNLTLAETKEEVLNCPSPIHPSVAGLVLKKDSHQRVLIPIARFYATNNEAEISEVYPVIHDTNGTIAKTHIEKNLKCLQNKPLWHYKNSERYVSFRLKDDEPIADNTADALYLAYIYLATNQTKKAWAVLEDCRTRLGGLTGSPAELQYLSWICNDVPHILTGLEKETKKAVRRTPPYMACKLKALSMLCDYVSQDHTFKIPSPTGDKDTANFHWEKRQYDDQVSFLNSLPSIIYKTFTRFQAMRRHLDDSYSLSGTERKRLLNHYQQTQESSLAPQGALAYEWMLLNLETLQQEHQTLLTLKSTKSLSEVDAQRPQQIEKYLNTLKPIIAVSSALQLKTINLKLAANCPIKQAHLSKDEIESLNAWIYKLPGKACSEDVLDEAVVALGSTISEGTLITHFPAYLQIMLGTNTVRKKALLDFCTKTLIAERHISLENQSTNRALFCNILYRAAHNNEQIASLSAPFNVHQLTLKSSSYYVPPLSVYEVVDVYKDILATPQEILDQHNVAPSLAVSSLTSTYVPVAQNIGKGTNLEFFINEYNELQQQHELGHEQLIKSININLIDLIIAEEQAGKNQLQLEQQQIALAQKLMSDSLAWSQMDALITSIEPKIHSASLVLWKKTLNLANEGPEDRQQMRLWLMEQAAKKRTILSKADLYSLYTKADLNLTIEKTGLSLKKAAKLHELMHDALAHGIQSQMVQKIQKAISKAKHSREARDLVPALDLLAKKVIPGLDSPAIVLLEHEEELILRPRQVSALKILLKKTTQKTFKETVEKIIPGGGKSKVILPIVAEQKAQGTNLVIVEVPQALLATNHVDLNRSSQRLFGKTAYRFEFNRDSNSSSKRLEELYNKFIEVMTSRSYIVTAGESMQSLELKYLELLLSEGPLDEEWEKQIYWCDKIINLIHHHGDAIIDEVHQGLWIKKKLNYTIGEQKPLPQATIQNAISLFQYIDPHFIKTAPLLNEEYNWTPFKHDLAKKLLKETNSPLHSFVNFAEKTYGSAVIKELFDYLTNTGDQPKIIQKAPAEIKAALAFFKQQINTLLPATLVRRLNTNYGASKKPNLSAIEQTLAIPYEANNIPNERSRFGNNLEAINYTCQMLFIKGVSKELLKEYLAQLQEIALQELFKNKHLARLDDTPTAQGFALLWPDLGLTLSQIKLDNEQQINTLHERLKDNKTLILDILQNQTLKHIPRDSSIIHSDSFNHVDLYHTVQAVSGTPSNHTTYHQRLEYDKTSSLGTDGYIIELLHHKKTAITHVDYETPTQFISHILTNSQEPAHCRALIDIRAAFQGIDNFTVAKELAAYILSHQAQFSTPLKHVLYFNDQQVLCAIEVNKPELPIILKTTDVNEINHLLGSTPNERFTYYDQARTLGTDITQDEQAHALVLVDEKTSLQSFLQGNMRMRGLGQKQSVELITPTKLSGITRAELVKKFSKTDRQTLLMDNLFAAKGQMANIARRHCLNIIQDLPSELAKTKAALAQAFKLFFVHTPSNDLFELYGALSKKQPTEQILKQYKQQLLILCTQAFTTGAIPLSDSDLNKMSLKLDDIITKALVHCMSEYENSIKDLSTEVEAQKEVHKATQIQVATINELFDPTLEESKPVVWKNYALSTLFSNLSELNKTSITINTMHSPIKAPLTLFSEQLRVSKSYAETHIKQKNYLDAFLKPASLIWYHMESGVLHAMILTPQELEHLKAHIEATPGNWVATTEDTLICGTQTDGVHLTKQYQALREQVRFFNGEFNCFLNPETQSEWLNEQTLQKLEFFEHHILPFRPGCEKKLQELKVLLTQSNIEGFAYIADHPYEDLTLFDWESLFPETSVAQAEDYKKMANAFLDIHSNWQTSIPSLTTLQQKFRLPLKSLSFVNVHLSHLQKFSSLLESIGKASLSLGKLLINPDERVILEHYLGQTLDNFYKQYPNSACAYIDLIERVSRHPALKNSIELINNLQRIAHLTNSVEILCKVLESPVLNKEILSSVLYSPIKDPALTDKLLSLPFKLFTEELIATLIVRCESEKQLRVLLTQDNLSFRTVSLLLEKNLSERQILELLPHVKENQILELIYYKLQNRKEIRQAIYKHPALSSSNLLSIINTGMPFEEELLSILNNPKSPIDPLVLSAVVVSPYYKEPILLAVAKHMEADSTVMEKIVNYSKCPPSLLLQIIEAKGPYIEFETLKIIARKAYNYALYDASNREQWEECALRSFEAIYKRGTTRTYLNSNQGLTFIFSLVNLFDLKYCPQFAIKILKILKQNISFKLPFEQMIGHADPEEMKILVDYNYTGPLLSSFLEQIYEKCSSPELIDLFIKRPDLSTTLFLKLLNKTDLTETQLQVLINNSNSDIVLEAAFEHPKATDLVRKTIYLHPHFSAKTLTFILRTKPPKEEDLLVLLHHSCFVIDTDVLQQISQTYALSEAIQLALVTHPKTNERVILKILDSYFSSPQLFLKILQQTQVAISSNLLLIMAKKAFAALEQSRLKERCEDCLVELFNQSLEIDAVAPMIELIQKNWLRPQLALKVLKIFSPRLLKEINLPLNDMALLAGNGELTNLMLLTVDKILDTESLLSLSEKCNTEELIELFLRRRDLDEPLYLSILKQEELSSGHLLVILKSSNLTPLVFNSICAHPKVNREVRTVLYHHRLRSSKSFFTILDNSDSIEAEEILFILNSFNDFLNAQGLKRIAESFLKNPQIFMALLIHPNTSEELMGNLLTTSWCSIPLLKTMIVQKGKIINPANLKQIAQFVLNQYPNSDEYKELEELLLLILNLAKEKNFSAEISSIIKSKELINSFLGLKILAILGSSALDHLPLSKMIELANQDELELFLQPEILALLSENLSLLLFSKCNNRKLLNLFLQKPHLSDELMLYILHHPLLEKEQFLLLLEQNPIGDGLLGAAFVHPHADEDVCDKICRHPSFSATNLSDFLDDDLLSDWNMLYLLNTPNHAVNTNNLAKAGYKFAHHSDILYALAHHPQAMNLGIVNQLTQNIFTLYEQKKKVGYLDDCLVHLFKSFIQLNSTRSAHEFIKKNNRLISPRLGLSILSLWGASLLAYLPLNQMIETAHTEQELNLLINLPELKYSELKKLSRKKLSTQQINLFLARSDISPDIAKSVLEKPEYNGQIGNWPWLTPSQLIHTLSHTRDFASFSIALHHKKLSIEEREQWFRTETQEYNKLEQRTQASPNRHQQLILAIEKLRIKAFTNALKAMTKDSYKEVAKTTFELYQQLSSQKEQIFKGHNQGINSIVLSIKHAKPVLETHRGNKQIILDILNVLLTIATFGLKTYTTRDWRFFKVNTDSLTVANNIKDCIDQFQSHTQSLLELN